MSATSKASLVAAALAAAALLSPMVLLVGGTANANCGSGLLPELPLPSASGKAKGGKPPGGWGGKVQRRNAGMIIAAGRELKVPPRGWVIAMAVGMQESSLRNLANSKVPASLEYPHDGVGDDHDSIGVFQQRPLPPDGDGAWGTVEELMSVNIAASKFYRTLLRVDGWQKMPLTKAAQAVQKSGTPTAYAKWEKDAEKLIVFTLGLPSLGVIGGAEPEAPCGLSALPGAAISAKGWVKPISAPVGSPFGPRGGSLHAGVDLSTKRGTPIRAAAAGKVVYADCDPGTGNCDVDGSPATPGCGWYVDIWHQGNVVTRYCHMLKRPTVRKGDVVKAGQVIGFEGTSGNSSGPHLHFEIHINVKLGGSADRSNAVDPVPFMQKVGAPLGEDRRQ